MSNSAALIALVVYSGVLVGVGLWAARRARSEDAFLLGGRVLGPVVAGLAYAASSSSAWVLLGFSGFVYAAGPSALWMLPGILAGYAAVWFCVGGVLQRQSKLRGHQTLIDFLVEDCPPRAARLIRIAAAMMITYCFSWYIAAQLQGAGQAFNGMFGIKTEFGILLGAALVLAYTFLGGFQAVSQVDMLQGLLIALVSVVLPAAAFIAAGGPSGIGQMLAEAPPAYQGWTGGRAGWAAGGFALGLAAIGFGALGQPHLIAWIMATRNRAARITGGGVALSWALLVYCGMAVLGLSARAVFGGDLPAESIFFESAARLLPDIFAGIIAAATLSAIMSTVDSQILVAGAALSHDLGLARTKRFRAVDVSRFSILAVCCAAICVALFLPSSIFERVLFAWVSLGAAFGPIVVARALKARPGGDATLAAMVVGFVAALICIFGYGWAPTSPWATVFPWTAAVAVLGAGEAWGRLRPGGRAGV
ncbi:sodium/proline symporter [Hyphomonas johnsonii]|uniref:Sodium/proline symporter n=1 Tax=Hyphomonas johnsonii MHS-2 TaxID=1280950 RepID=A0A059FG10_9PROT|nr:sodium/proline symporter [Hyphomonas johnsonii]KCZ89522.1 cation/acetate symporter ActP [Hyphomonas johnsonii MHS-2]